MIQLVIKDMKVVSGREAHESLHERRHYVKTSLNTIVARSVGNSNKFNVHTKRTQTASTGGKFKMNRKQVIGATMLIEDVVEE